MDNSPGSFFLVVGWRRRFSGIVNDCEGSVGVDHELSQVPNVRLIILRLCEVGLVAVFIRGQHDGCRRESGRGA